MTISTQPDARMARRAALASFTGAVVDWYDFFLYGIVAALVFNQQFFPSVDPAVGTLAAFATFGVGFLFRPLGGIVFGHFGDKLGHKKMLVLTMLMMGAATTLIGVIPNYEQIGLFAPLLLVLLRATQGFAVGGEWGGAALMAVGNAPSKWKALYGSGVQVGASVGLLLATAATTGASLLTTDAGFRAWGWRLPFLASVLIVFIGLIIRTRVQESPEFTRGVEKVAGQARTTPPLISAIKKHPKAFLAIIGLRLPELLTFYLVTTFALSYGTQYLGLRREDLLANNLLVGALGIISIPAFAYLTDKFGRRLVYVVGCLVGALGSIPFFLAMQSGSLVLIYALAIILVNVSHDMVVSVQQPLFTEMFGPGYKYSGAGVGYQLASAIGGGFTPFIASWLVLAADGSYILVAGYLILGCLIALVIALRLPADRPANQFDDVSPVDPLVGSHNEAGSK